MIRVNVLIDDDILAAISDTALRSPKLMQTAFNRQVGRLRKRILEDLQQDPGPVVYANQGRLRWKSGKQWRAFFATDGFGKGIPAERTGALLDAYDVQFVPQGDSGGALQITNETPYAEFVVGDDAQPFHLDTGWVQVADVVVKYEDIVTDALIETWFVITDPFAGVPK